MPATPKIELKKEVPLCPDGNHPHMIDLGLPDGTKWACCNVGASSPEGYGGYYAWGETSEKSYYDWDTYQYYNGNLDYPDCYIYIGDNISGTGYDAATANWGAPWRMPSLEQIKSLLDNCSSVLTQVNGVNGKKFTGPNGNSIFLPAAGSRWRDSLYSEGSSGSYWSGTLSSSISNYACSLDFGSGGAYCIDDYRGYGLSVRPVSE